MLSAFREFLVLADCLSFVKAAERLHISQPSLTRHIAALEREVGFRLFERSPMALTPAGQFFHAGMSGLVEQYDDLVVQSRSLAADHRTGLTVNMVTSSNNRFSDAVYEGMTILRSKHPHLPLPQLLDDDQLTIPASVFAGKADVGIVFSVPAQIPEGFACEKLIDLPLMVLMHEDNPAAQLPNLTVEDLADCSLICPSSPRLQATFEGAVELMRAHGIEPHYRVRVLNEFDRIPFTIQPDEILFKTSAPHLPSPASFLIEKSFAEPVPNYHVYALYRTDADDPAITEFVSIIREVTTKRLISQNPAEPTQ